jgi:hypothetical protein
MFCHFDYGRRPTKPAMRGQWHPHDEGFFEAYRPRSDTELACMIKALHFPNALADGTARRRQIAD